MVNKEIAWYRCDKCYDFTLLNIKGTCPGYCCEGTLQACDPEDDLADNHYRRLYLETLPLAARAEEHTAQLTSRAAARLQTDFVNGKVNILSCSTTFELGVDVGELEAVFMRNVPPSAANYVQRAGRAGRRTDSTAFSLTFAQRRSHDLNHFAEPWRMVAGKIGVPYFKIANEKVVRRHLYAVILSAFWKQHTEHFGNVEKFFTRCGYTLVGGENVTGHHIQSWGGKCDGTLYGGFSLGHEFETDLVQLIFEGYQNVDRGFWYSLLYALLEGCSEALDIERQDLDGVLYHINGNSARPAIVLFDDVPGGAGHAHRIAHPNNLEAMLESTLTRLKRCECGGEEAETSCYGCLRHCRNQFCHDQLNRRKVIDFLTKLSKGVAGFDSLET